MNKLSSLKRLANVGPTDRALRFVVGVVVAAVAFTVLDGLAALTGIVVALVLIGTAAIGFCPLYRLLGLNSRPMHGWPPAH